MTFQETDHITLNKPTSKHFCRFQGETGVYPGRLVSTANLISNFFPYTPHKKWATDRVCLPFNLHETIVSVTTVMFSIESTSCGTCRNHLVPGRHPCPYYDRHRRICRTPCRSWWPSGNQPCKGISWYGNRHICMPEYGIRD